MFVARAAQAIARRAVHDGRDLASRPTSARPARAALGGVLEDAPAGGAVRGRRTARCTRSRYYAMAARPYLHRYGGTREQLAEVAVAAREWALLNPAAFRHDAGPLTVDDVLDAPMVSSPLTVADCCLVTDGGGAVVLTSLERARDLRRTPVEVLGYGERTTNTSMTAVDDLARTGRRAARAPTRSPAPGITAGRRRRARGLRLVHDHRARSASRRSASAARARCSTSSRTAGSAPAARCRSNTSGGGLSYCHPGQFGVLLLVEAVRQLRGECGARQVAGAGPPSPTAPAASCPRTPPSCWGSTDERPPRVRCRRRRRHRATGGTPPASTG